MQEINKQQYIFYKEFLTVPEATVPLSIVQLWYYMAYCIIHLA